MQWDKGSDRSVLHVTPAVTLRGIPAEAHKYVVNGRTPLEWAVDRLHISHDDESGIVKRRQCLVRRRPGRAGGASQTPGACER